MAALIQERIAVAPGVAAATAELASRLSAGTVEVRSQGHGNGSGVIWQSDGLIVTNHHVVHGERIEVVLSSGRTLPSRVVARHPERDLAALRVDAQDLPALPIGDASGVKVGQLVVAMGNPLGLKSALTFGIIHAVGGSGRGRDGAGMIRADLSLAPGNSGGPLADVQGRVIGINSMVAGGLALAIPSTVVSQFLGGGSQPAFLGVEVQAVGFPAAFARQAEIRQETGLLVLTVHDGSPAVQAGLQQGDILLGAGSTVLEEPADLVGFLRDTSAGTMVPLQIVRGGVRREINAAPSRRAPEAQ